MTNTLDDTLDTLNDTSETLDDTLYDTLDDISETLDNALDTLLYRHHRQYTRKLKNPPYKFLYNNGTIPMQTKHNKTEQLYRHIW